MGCVTSSFHSGSYNTKEATLHCKSPINGGAPDDRRSKKSDGGPPPSRELASSPTESTRKGQAPQPPKLEPIVLPQHTPEVALDPAPSIPDLSEVVLQSNAQITLQPKTPPPTVETKPFPESEPQQTEEDGSEELYDKPEVEGAVVKIQAGIRGYLTRKALKDRPKPGLSVDKSLDQNPLEVDSPEIAQDELPVETVTSIKLPKLEQETNANKSVTFLEKEVENRTENSPISLPITTGIENVAQKIAEAATTLERTKLLNLGEKTDNPSLPSSEEPPAAKTTVPTVESIAAPARPATADGTNSLSQLRDGNLNVTGQIQYSPSAELAEAEDDEEEDEEYSEEEEDDIILPTRPTPAQAAEVISNALNGQHRVVAELNSLIGANQGWVNSPVFRADNVPNQVEDEEEEEEEEEEEYEEEEESGDEENGPVLAPQNTGSHPNSHEPIMSPVAPPAPVNRSAGPTTRQGDV